METDINEGIEIKVAESKINQSLENSQWSGPVPVDNS